MTKIARRHVLATLAKGAAGLPLAVVLADSGLARAAAADLEPVSITLADGHAVKAVLALPATTPAPAVLLVHEWWGLNDQIKAVAADLAREGYLALAIDLYDGAVATTPAGARALMGKVDGDRATATLAAWIDWLRARPDATGKVGTVGWCFGGGWSLIAALARPVEATVVYYGRVDETATQLAPLAGPVLGHFATRDGWIDRPMVKGFARAMKAAGKSLTAYWYEADHAFANPSGGRYDAADAALAWRRTLAFFKDRLG